MENKLPDDNMLIYNYNLCPSNILPLEKLRIPMHIIKNKNKNKNNFISIIK